MILKTRHWCTSHQCLYFFCPLLTKYFNFFLQKFIFLNNRNYKDSVFVDYFDKDEKTDKSLEIIVKVFNIIKYKEITGFLDCKPIQEYNRFVQIMREHYNPKNPESFTPAIQIALKQNVMPNYTVHGCTVE